MSLQFLSLVWQPDPMPQGQSYMAATRSVHQAFIYLLNSGRGPCFLQSCMTLYTCDCCSTAASSCARAARHTERMKLYNL